MLGQKKACDFSSIDESSRTSNVAFISWIFSKDTMEDEVVWLIGNFLHNAWIEQNYDCACW